MATVGCPNCGCPTLEHKYGGIGVCKKHGCEDTRSAVPNYMAQAEAAQRWFVLQRDDHAYYCVSRLGGLMFDSCTCAVMPGE